MPREFQGAWKWYRHRKPWLQQTTTTYKRSTPTTSQSSRWCGRWAKQSSAQEVFWEGNKVANPVKVSPQYEEEEDVKQPADGEERPNADERADQQRRSLPGHKLGYFRTHPRAKWVIAAALLVIVAAGIFVWHYYSGRES